jgi:hypothetical protein
MSYKFSSNSKSFSQAMEIYGSRHMYDLLSLNYGGPPYSIEKKS